MTPPALHLAFYCSTLNGDYYLLLHGLSLAGLNEEA